MRTKYRRRAPEGVPDGVFQLMESYDIGMATALGLIDNRELHHVLVGQERRRQNLATVDRHGRGGLRPHPPDGRGHRHRLHATPPIPKRGGFPPSEEDDQADDDEPLVEEIEEPDPFEDALAYAEREYNQANRNRLSICVRCGLPVQNRGNKPYPDDNGVPWLRCPRGCQPPQGAPASCVPMDSRRYESVLDRPTLNPDDALYQGPDDPVGDKPE